MAGASDYSSLTAGPSTGLLYEGPKARAVDGTKKSLRHPVYGSPFTLRIVPPAPLLAALAGRGEVRVGGAFDAVLRQQRAAVEAQIVAGTAPAAAVEQLLGTRANVTPGFAIIDAALSTTTNFRQSQEYRKTVSRNLLPGSASPAPTLIGGNGKRLTDQKQAPGNEPALADLRQAQSILRQVAAMQAAPPLTLLINPQSLSLTYAKKQVYQERNRNGLIFQAWGEEQVQLAVSGRAGAFYTGALKPEVDEQGKTSSTSGVQWASRRDSATWQNFSSLFTFYLSNGLLHNPDGSEAHLWVGNVEIRYDQFIYWGNFDTFNFSFTEEQQGGVIDFDFSFTVSEMMDVAQRGPVLPQKGPTPSPSTPQQLQPTMLPSGTSPGTVSGSPPEVATSILDPFL